jgi:hypothetical protein
LRLLTLLSDFGGDSPYPAAMKAVVAAHVDAFILDITHNVARHDVRQGAFMLASVAPYCPAGTVHLAVVDPGVGTSRRPLIVTAGGQALVGPDNGLLLPAARRLGRAVAYQIDPVVALLGPSRTFHGRDLFAPAAARLLRGEPPSRLGMAVSDPVTLSLPEGGWRDGILQGEILYVDPFGNLITSIPNETVGADAAFQLQTPEGTRGVRLRSAYGAGAPGELMLVPGSQGLLEIAVREGDAAATTRLRGGAPLRLYPEGGPLRLRPEGEGPA